MTAESRLKIGLECRIDDPRSGVGATVSALAQALSESPAADQEYTFIVNRDTRWLEPHIFGHSKIAYIDRHQPSRAKRSLKGISPLQPLLTAARLRFLTPPKSDGYVEAESFDVVHFLTPAGYRTSCPTIYQPHDLQHLHYPAFFSTDEFRQRDKSYRALCQQAAIVCVHTEWSKQDLIEKMGLPASKIAVVPWGCVFDPQEEILPDQEKLICEKLRVPPTFFLYPAVTWPHKNHVCILRAMQILRDQHGRDTQVCFTGRSTEYRVELDRLVDQLDLGRQVHFLGFLSPGELQALFKRAVAMVYPSKFEGFGLPILEAYRSSLPVICARSSCLPEVAQDGALYFDPDRPEQLAACMLEILDNKKVRIEKQRRGLQIVSGSTFKRVAAEFQKLYRRVAESARNRSVLDSEPEEHRFSRLRAQ